MNKEIQKGYDLLKNQKPIVVSCYFKQWNYKFANKRDNNNHDYGYFYIHDKFILCCHGGQQQQVQIRMEHGVKMLSHSLEQIVKKFRPLLKGSKNLYIDCCYGASKRTTIDGINIIPLNASRHVSSRDGWYCDSLEDFDLWYKTIVKEFQVKVTIAESQVVSTEDDELYHHDVLLKAKW